MALSDLIRRRLMEHLRIVARSVELLGELFEEVADGDRVKAHRLAEEIYREERNADSVKIELRKDLPRTFFRSVERSDLLALVKAHDDIADACKEVATFLDVYEVAFGVSATRTAIALYRKVRDAFERHTQFIEKFLVQGARDAAEVENEFLVYWPAADRYEEEIEQLCRDALRDILKNETVTRSALLLMRVVEHTASIMSKTRNAVDCLDRMLRA